MARVAPILIFSLCFAAGCSGPSSTLPIDPNDPNNPNDPNDPNDPVVVRPNFHEDIEPLLQKNCQTCHRPDGPAPFSMLGYETTRPWAARMAQVTEERSMPPWLAQETSECQPPHEYANDIRLAQSEIDLIKAWADKGAPEGDRAKAPQPVSFNSLGLVDATHNMTSGSPYMVMPGQDQFRCFVFDPQLQSDTYVNGFAYLPSNAKVTHHALLFLDPDHASDGMVGPDGSYDCFGGPGFNNTQVLLAWAPGALNAELPSNIAYRVPAHAKLVLQVHYHPTLDSFEMEQSRVQMRTSTNRPEWVTQILLIGNFEGPFGSAVGDGLMPGMEDRNADPEFRIPAGSAAHVEEMRFTLPATLQGNIPIPDLKVLAAATHMHYVGTDMIWSIEHTTPKSGESANECMIHTPQWNFEWQRAYAFNVPVEQAPEFRPGDVLHMRCTYNNSMANPFVVRALRERGLSAPQDVFLGEQTLDEMCLAVFAIAYPNPF